MLWLINKGASHQIIGCNIHKEEGKFQLWVERVNGKTLKVVESADKGTVEEVKDAIDFAIESGHKTLELD